MNKTILSGNITRDIELRYTQSNIPVCDFDIAINEQETTEYIKIQCWKKTAENVVKYCRKGSKVIVDGRLKTESWNDKDTGKKRSKIIVVASRVEFLDTKKSSEDNPQPTDKVEELPKVAPPNLEDLPF